MSLIKLILKHVDANKISPFNWTLLCGTNAIKIIENELRTTFKELCKHSNNYAIKLITMQLYTGAMQ